MRPQKLGSKQIEQLPTSRRTFGRYSCREEMRPYMGTSSRGCATTTCLMRNCKLNGMCTIHSPAIRPGSLDEPLDACTSCGTGAARCQRRLRPGAVSVGKAPPGARTQQLRRREAGRTSSHVRPALARSLSGRGEKRTHPTMRFSWFAPVK